MAVVIGDGLKRGRRFIIPGAGEIFNEYGTDLVTITCNGVVVQIEGKENIKAVSEALRKIRTERGY